MRILLINHYAGSPQLGMEFRPYYLAREWQRMGHQVYIVGASYSHLRQLQPPCGQTLVRETLTEIHYLWLRTPSYVGNGLGRVRNMLTFLARLWVAAPQLARQLKPEVVIASSTYPADVFPAQRIAALCRARRVFEVHDLWPLSPRVLGGMPAWHPFIVAMQVAENRAYRWAERVVSLLPLAREHMVRHGMAPEKFVYIPNGVAVDEWTNSRAPLPEEHRRILSHLRQEGKFVVCYAGSHGVANALEYFVEAAPLLEGSPVHLVLVGAGPEKPALEARARRLSAQRVTFLPPVQRHALPALFALADALYLGWRRCALYRYGISPNKLLDYMMAAKPVLHAVEAGNDPVAEARCGLTVEPESPPAIARGVGHLLALSPQERAAMGTRGRTFVLEKHDYRVLAQRFLAAVASGQVQAV